MNQQCQMLKATILILIIFFDARGRQENIYICFIDVQF